MNVAGRERRAQCFVGLQLGELDVGEAEALDLVKKLAGLVAVAAQHDLDVQPPVGQLAGQRHHLAKALLAAEIAAVQHLHARSGDGRGGLDMVGVDPQRDDLDGHGDADAAQLVLHLGRQHGDEVGAVEDRAFGRAHEPGHVAAADHAELLGQARLDVMHDGDADAATPPCRHAQRHAQDRRAEGEHDGMTLDPAGDQRRQAAQQEFGLVGHARDSRSAARRTGAEALDRRRRRPSRAGIARRGRRERRRHADSAAGRSPPWSAGRGRPAIRRCRC